MGAFDQALSKAISSGDFSDLEDLFKAQVQVKTFWRKDPKTGKMIMVHQHERNLTELSIHQGHSIEITHGLHAGVKGTVRGYDKDKDNFRIKLENGKTSGFKMNAFKHLHEHEAKAHEHEGMEGQVPEQKSENDLADKKKLADDKSDAASQKSEAANKNPTPEAHGEAQKAHEEAAKAFGGGTDAYDWHKEQAGNHAYQKQKLEEETAKKKEEPQVDPEKETPAGEEGQTAEAAKKKMEQRIGDASKKTSKAIEENTPEAHLEAKKAHEYAAKAAEEAGNEKSAKYHGAMANQHAKHAEAQAKVGEKNIETETPAPKSGWSFKKDVLEPLKLNRIPDKVYVGYFKKNVHLFQDNPQKLKEILDAQEEHKNYQSMWALENALLDSNMDDEAAQVHKKLKEIGALAKKQNEDSGDKTVASEEEHGPQVGDPIKAWGKTCKITAVHGDGTINISCSDGTNHYNQVPTDIPQEKPSLPPTLNGKSISSAEKYQVEYGVSPEEIDSLKKVMMAAKSAKDYEDFQNKIEELGDTVKFQAGQAFKKAKGGGDDDGIDRIWDFTGGKQSKETSEEGSKKLKEKKASSGSKGEKAQEEKKDDEAKAEEKVEKPVEETKKVEETQAQVEKAPEELNSPKGQENLQENVEKVNKNFIELVKEKVANLASKFTTSIFDSTKVANKKYMSFIDKGGAVGKSNIQFDSLTGAPLGAKIVHPEVGDLLKECAEEYYKSLGHKGKLKPEHVFEVMGWKIDEVPGEPDKVAVYGNTFEMKDWLHHTNGGTVYKTDQIPFAWKVDKSVVQKMVDEKSPFDWKELDHSEKKQKAVSDDGGKSGGSSKGSTEGGPVLAKLAERFLTEEEIRGALEKGIQSRKDLMEKTKS